MRLTLTCAAPALLAVFFFSACGGSAQGGFSPTDGGAGADSPGPSDGGDGNGEQGGSSARPEGGAESGVDTGGAAPSMGGQPATGAGGEGGGSEVEPIPCASKQECEDDNPCTIDTCKFGLCSNLAVDVNDDNACTQDTCTRAGIKHVPIDPNDNNACTVDACKPNTGVSHTLLAVDDGDACTTDECTPANGISHTPVDPDDNDDCTVDSCDSQLGVGHLPVAVNDNNACTTDACSKQSGISHTAVTCDDDNACTVDTCDQAIGCKFTGANIATGATASASSGGAVADYLPAQLNNGIDQAGSCSKFSWISNGTVAGGAYFELDWAAPVTIDSIFIDTINAAGGGPCALVAGRNVASATVQYWNGSIWVTSTSFSGKTDDVTVDLPSPVTTTKLRLYDVTTSAGNGNSLIFELFVYQGGACAQ